MLSVERKCALGTIGLAVSLTLARPSGAETMRNVPLGGRTATMGGAATAAGNDSAMPYVNPAGLASIPGDIFAVSANLYGYARRSVPKLNFPEGTTSQLGEYRRTNKELEASGVIDMPSSIMYFQHVGEPADEFHHIFGLSLVIPYATSTELVGSTTMTFPGANGHATENVNVIHNTTDYYVGPSYAFSYDDRLRVGASLFALHTRSLKSIQYASKLSLSGGSVSSSTAESSAANNQAWGLVPIVGFQAWISEELWLGAAVAAPSFHLYGSRYGTAETHGLDSDPNNLGGLIAMEAQRSEKGSYQNARPLRLNIGGAWEDRGTFSVAVDGYVFFARKSAFEVEARRDHLQSHTRETTRTYSDNLTASRDTIRALGASLGMEFGLTDWLALRTGAFSDVSNVEEFNDDFAWYYEVREDRAGATLGLGVQFGSFDTTVGAVYTHGWGKMQVYDRWSDRAFQSAAEGKGYYPRVDTTFDSLLLVFSGAVTTEEAKAQMREVSPVWVEPTPAPRNPGGAQ